ncbi:MAG: DUF1289 domain-containing protein [Bacteroidota bacterium]
MEYSHRIISPCKSICKLNDEGWICTGCFRTRQEIESWFWLSEEQKARIVAQLPAREKDMK